MASRFKELDLRAPGWRSGIRKVLLLKNLLDSTINADTSASKPWRSVLGNN